MAGAVRASPAPQLARVRWNTASMTSLNRRKLRNPASCADLGHRPGSGVEQQAAKCKRGASGRRAAEEVPRCSAKYRRSWGLRADAPSELVHRRLVEGAALDQADRARRRSARRRVRPRAGVPGAASAAAADGTGSQPPPPPRRRRRSGRSCPAGCAQGDRTTVDAGVFTAMKNRPSNRASAGCLREQASCRSILPPLRRARAGLAEIGPQGHRSGLPREPRRAVSTGRSSSAGETNRHLLSSDLALRATPLRKNVPFFACAAAAEEAGFRPCRRCRPDAAPGTPAWVGPRRRLPRGPLDRARRPRRGVGRRARWRVGLGGRQLRRLFAEHLGTSPLLVARSRARSIRPPAARRHCHGR